jgi:hypothetical protein
MCTLTQPAMHSLFSTVPQPQLNLNANNRERHEQQRRLYMSCDQCRVFRQPCDAVDLGTSPVQQRELGVNSLQPPCTTCRKAGRNCTFEWLRSVAQRNLLQSAKRKFDVAQHLLPQANGEIRPLLEESASTKPRIITNDQTRGSAAGSDRFHFQGLGSVDKTGDREPTNQPAVMAKSNLELRYNDDLRKDFDHLAHFSDPTLPGANAQTEDESYNNCSSFPSTRTSFSLPSDDSDPFKTGWYSWSPLQPGDWSSPPTLPSDDETKFTQWLEVTPSSSSSKPTFATYAMLRFQNPDANPVQRNTSSTSTSRAPLSNPEVNMQENRLYEVASKSFIISGLKQIYDNSLENGMSLWGTEQNCPFEDGSISFRKRANREDSSALLPTSLYQRAYQLDQAVAPLRTRPLTATEDGWASRALKLAIMAFASRWSHSQMTCFPEKDSLDNIGSQDPTFESNEFERLLQQSLYNEAVACIERWSDCDSFRIILAQLLVFFIQKPPDDIDVLDVQKRWTKLKSRGDSERRHGPAGTTNIADDRPNVVTESSCESISTDHFTTSQSFRRLMKSDSRENSLRNALQHLLAWSPKIRTVTKRALLHSRNAGADPSMDQAAMQTSSNFNILFWLGVMCDTAGAALDRGALIISDDDAELHFSERLFSEMSVSRTEPESYNYQTNSSKDNTPKSPAASKLWGEFLMHSQMSCENPFLYTGSAFVESAEKVLREASPLKILLMRKVCDLQTLMKENPPPEVVERCINDTLQVCTYWHARFGEFFANCIAQHQTIPFQIRTWYVMLIGHWNLAYLQVANCIEQFDQHLKSDTLQSALRRSSFLTLQLQKEGIYSIASIARVSYTDILRNGYDMGNRDYHSTCRGSSLLTDPCGDIMFLALSTSCDIFLAWSQTLQSPPDCANLQNVWLHRSLELDELLDSCGICIKALKVFGKQYDVATLVAKVFEERMKSGRSDAGGRT